VTSIRDIVRQRLIPRLLRLVEAVEDHLPGRTQTLAAQAPVSQALETHLFITHGRGGGADKHVAEQAAGKRSLVLSFHWLTRAYKLDGQSFWSPDALLKHLRAQGVTHLHLHHTRFFPYSFIRALPEFAGALGVHYDVMLHDFTAFCPRIHLIDEHWRYCGMPTDPTICTRCITSRGMLTSAPFNITAWRESWQRIFAHAKAVHTPSNDTTQRHQTFFPDAAITTMPHEDPSQLLSRAPDAPRARVASEARRIVVIGNIRPLKGAHIVLACAQDAKNRGLELEFSVIGECSERAALEALGVTVSGPYAAGQLPELLRKSGAHAVFLPSTWPETYSYVLSEIWANGVYPIAFDFGAPAERIRAGKGALLALNLMNDPAAINQRLLELIP
jgi:glycosyltransferase involved in cell wall biosynthesis